MELTIQTIANLTPPLFAKIQDLLDRAVKASADNVTIEYVVDKIVTGQAILWVVSTVESRGVIVTSIIDHGKGQSLLVWLMAGEAIAQYSRQIQKRLEVFASESGCAEIRTVVSNKKLENHMLGCLGYKLGGTVLYKEVSHERIVSKPDKSN